MGFPLGLLIANIFMVSKKKDLIPTLKLFLCNWERHSNDTHAYLEPTRVEVIF